MNMSRQIGNMSTRIVQTEQLMASVAAACCHRPDTSRPGRRTKSRPAINVWVPKLIPHSPLMMIPL
jgi:hypothetical protein